MNFITILTHAVTQKASDIHLATGVNPLMRLNTKLVPITTDSTLDDQTIHSILQEIIPNNLIEVLKSNTEIDFATTITNLARLRIHIFKQHHGVSIAIRILPTNIPSIAELNLTDILYHLCDLPSGLILITGPTGCGKTTSLAAIIDHINTTKNAHIITIEDPIEYIHKNKQSLIQQREIGIHTTDVNTALRSVLREDPDYISIGELRDLTTIRLALTAAETGHLILATLHTNSATETIDRIIDVFPAHEKSLIRNVLSNTLQAVISQLLVPKKNVGMMALQEIMLCNTAIRNLIRTEKTAQIYSVIQTNQSTGMQTFDQHLNILSNNNIIDLNTIKLKQDRSLQ